MAPSQRPLSAKHCRYVCRHVCRQCSWQLAIALSSIVTVALLGLAQLGVFQPLELDAFDLFTRMTTQHPHLLAKAAAPDQVVIVAITEEDIQRQKQWPLSDQIFAQVLSALQQHHPQVIGLDIYRDVPHEPGTEALAAQLQQPNVVTITKLDELGAAEVPSPLQVPESRVGFNDFVIDPDGVVRRNFMFAAVGDRQLYSFSLRLVEKILAARQLSITPERQGLQVGNTQFQRIKANAGGYQTIDATGYQTLVRYFAPTQSARQLSLTHILSGNFDPRWIEGKAVLIGTTAPSQKDLFYTPFSYGTGDKLLTSGVALHAQMTHQMLSAALGERALLGVWPQWAELIWVCLWGLGGGFLAWRFSHLRTVMICAAGGLVGLWAITWLLFTQAIWVPWVLPMTAFSLTGAELMAFKEFRRAYYDATTGLPNRARLAQVLQKRLKRQPYRPVAVVLLGIDRFRAFNESFGSQVSDRLLQTTARRLQQNLPPTATVARVAGGEFAILLSLVGSDTALALAEALNQRLSEPVELSGQRLFPTVSIGLAFSSTHATDYLLSAEDALRDAQTALSQARANGQGRCEMFVTDMRIQLSHRLWLETNLHEALERQEFLLYYQPIICLKTLTLSGFEALIRWQHPDKGMVFPDTFIPVAEETGLIVPMGQWVIETACKQAQKWHQKFPEQAPFMSINLSGRQFAQPDLVGQVDRVLVETGLERSCLKLELTESVVMEDVEASIAVLLQLKALKLRLGIDDFGTGYSSLSCLHRFPIDTLKIDKSFIMAMTTAGDAPNLVRTIPGGTTELVKTIVALAHNLGMNVIAEGVETADQARQLQGMQCEYGQGYLFARPMSSLAVESLLAGPETWPDQRV